MFFGTLSSIASGGSLPFGMAQPTVNSGLSPFALSSPSPLFDLLGSSTASLFGALRLLPVRASFILVCDACACALSMVKACLELGRASVDEIAVEGDEVVEDGSDSGDGSGQEEGGMG
ncbi:hypothetical protein ACJRO7_032989 [Eucalyptus globulus]|uniref:Secreted protein n=1 Tax=Eucalyptus globulus TaxID=34317 RepID=A0ABD3JLM5_EUCGL